MPKFSNEHRIASNNFLSRMKSHMLFIPPCTPAFTSKGSTFRSLDEVRDAVAKAVEFYNKRRPHMSIDMMTPVEARQYSGLMVKRWRSYREEAIAKNNPTIGLPDTSVQGLT